MTTPLAPIKVFVPTPCAWKIVTQLQVKAIDYLKATAHKDGTSDDTNGYTLIPCEVIRVNGEQMTVDQMLLPKEGYFFLKEELTKLLGDAFDAGRSGPAKFSKDIFDFDFSEDYVKTILP